jgi:hypothetical protein
MLPTPVSNLRAFGASNGGCVLPHRAFCAASSAVSPVFKRKQRYVSTRFDKPMFRFIIRQSVAATNPPLVDLISPAPHQQWRDKSEVTLRFDREGMISHVMKYILSQ